MKIYYTNSKSLTKESCVLVVKNASLQMPQIVVGLAERSVWGGARTRPIWEVRGLAWRPVQLASS
jgi:hypothetical protein